MPKQPADERLHVGAELNEQFAVLGAGQIGVAAAIVPQPRGEGRRCGVELVEECRVNAGEALRGLQGSKIKAKTAQAQVKIHKLPGQAWIIRA